MKVSFIRAFVPLSMLYAVFAITAAAQSGRVQQTPTPTPDDEIVRVSTEEVKLNVLAFDEQGAFVKDVTDHDLIVREDNVIQPPSSVRRLPANVLIVMDTGGEMRAVKSLDKTRAVARSLIAGLRGDDSVAIMTYADKPEMLLEWTNDRTAMLTAIKRSNFGRSSAFVDALKLAKDFFARSGVDNKHLVLITDGTDSTAGSSAKYDAMQALLTTDITVHVLSYTQMESDDIEPRTKTVTNTPPKKVLPDEVAAQLPNGARDTATAPKMKTINLDRTLIRKIKLRKADLDASQEQLEKLAESTNGEFILPLSPDEMETKAGLVASMIDSSYVVTYMPKIPVTPTRGIAERNIEVTSKRPGLIVQSKRKVLLKVGQPQ